MRSEIELEHLRMFSGRNRQSSIELRQQIINVGQVGFLIDYDTEPSGSSDTQTVIHVPVLDFDFELILL
jgi:hypothetical protein